MRMIRILQYSLNIQIEEVALNPDMAGNKGQIYQSFIAKEDQRSRVEVTGPLAFILDYSEYVIRTEFDKHAKNKYKFKMHKGSVSEDYMRAFGELRLEDKVRYYNKNVVYLLRIINNNNRPPQVEDKIMEVFAQVRSFSLRRWKKKKVRLVTSRKMLYLEKQQTIREYDLGNYLFRGSKNNEYFVCVLEAINSQVHEKEKTVHIGFNTLALLEEWSNALQLCVDFKNWERIFRHVHKHSIDVVEKVLGQKASMPRLKTKTESNHESQDSKSENDTTSLSHEITDTKQLDSHSFGQSPTKVVEKTQNVKSESSDGQKQNNFNRTIVEDLLDEDIGDDEIYELEKRNKQEYNSQKIANTDLFHRMFPEVELENLENQNNMEMIESMPGKMRVMRDMTSPDKYKMVFEFPTGTVKPLAIFNSISGPELCTRYHLNLEEVSVKTFISSQNSAILYMMLKPYSKLYRSRDFLFIRHAFKNGNSLYIADKSIQNANFPPFITIVRGELSAVWGILPKKDTISVVCDIEMKNNGYLNDSQNQGLVLQYLKGFVNLCNFVKENEQTAENYRMFDLKWDIAKNSNNLSANQERKERIRAQRKLIEKKRKQQRLEMQSPKNQLQPLTNSTKEKSVMPSQTEPKMTLSTGPGQIDIQELELLANNKSEINLVFDKEGYVIIDKGFSRQKYQLTPTKSESMKCMEYDHNGKHPIWKDQWLPDHKEGAIIYVNKKKMQAQRGVLKFILSKIGKNLLSGKSVLNISLPVDIFVAKSNLEILISSMSYAPLLLQKVVNQPVLDKFKATVAFGISMSPLYLNIEKPFNPILGQTFQAWINGCPAYAQQISHHPPIASLLFYGRGYQISAQLESKVELHMNRGCGTNDGPFRFKFDTGQQIFFTSPGGELSGLTYGERKFNIVGKSYSWNEKEKLFCEIVFNPSKKGFFSVGKQDNPIDYFEGQLLEVKPEFFMKFDCKKKRVPTENEIVRKLGKFSGIWHKQLLYDSTCLLDFDKELPYVMECEEKPLPSDANWREDIAYRRLMQVKRAQMEKERLEVLQRTDRKLREQK